MAKIINKMLTGIRFKFFFIVRPKYKNSTYKIPCELFYNKNVSECIDKIINCLLVI